MTIVSTGRGGDALLERGDALATLSEALSDARIGHGRLLLLAGEAGIGKTTVVRAFTAIAPRDTRVLAGACDPLSTPRPFGPLADAAEPGGPLAELIARGAPPAEVFATLREELEQQVSVLVVEDVHWADEATLDVLRLLVRRIESLPTLLIATYRDDGLDRAHPLRVFLGDLATATATARIHLGALSADAVVQLAFGHPIDPAELHRKTGGNPFFAKEVLASGSTAVPATVRDAVLGRAAGLDDAALGLLESVALAPPRAEPWLLEAVAGETVDRTEDCLAVGLVTVDERGVSFRHELARLAIEEATPPMRRRALHSRILAALADPPTGELDHARLAHHAEGALDADAVQTFAPAAAARAAAAGSHREAAAQYARALRFGADLPPEARATLLEGRSRACYLADDQLEAIDVIREAIMCRRQQDAPLQEARALTELADYLMCRGFLGEAHETLRRADGLLAGQPEQREHAYVLNIDGRLRGHGDPELGIRLAQRAIEIGARHGDEYVTGHARVTAASATARLDLDAGLTLLEHAVQIGREQSQPEVVARGLNHLGAAAARSHQHELAERHYAAALEHCAEYTSDLWRINVLAASALSFLARGRFDDAARRAVAVLDDPRESPWPHHAALVVLGLVRARRGDPGARDALEEAGRVDVQPDEVDDHVDRAVALSEVAWLEGRHDEIAGLTERPLQAAVERNDVSAVCRLSFWCRLAGLEVDVPAGAPGPYALALTGEWERAAEEWASRGEPYEAALALAQSDDVEELRRAHAELQRLGARPLATRVARALRERGARDVPRGPRPSTRANRAELTVRELDVLQLVAGGLRNTDIAERLIVSRKTVDHHVAAILRKLAVDSRGKAVAEARRLGLVEDR